MDRAHLQRSIAVGKSFIGYVVPMLYHTCELQESYVSGRPVFDMADNKWKQDIDPGNASFSNAAVDDANQWTWFSRGKVRDMGHSPSAPRSRSCLLWRRCEQSWLYRAGFGDHRGCKVLRWI